MEEAQINEMMDQALHAAGDGLGQGFLPVGAVIAFENKVIACRHNLVQTGGPLLVHAEWLALNDIDAMSPDERPGRRRDMVLFTTLEPCMMCLGAAANCHIGQVHYALETDEDGFVDAAKRWEQTRSRESRNLFVLPEVNGGTRREESRMLFGRFAEENPGSPFAGWAQSLFERGDRLDINRAQH